MVLITLFMGYTDYVIVVNCIGTAISDIGLFLPPDTARAVNNFAYNSFAFYCCRSIIRTVPTPNG